MLLPLLPVLLLASVVTATLSATFGMAGGLLLMGVYTALLPVPEAMVLHGVTQLVANGGRAWLLRAHVRWRGIVGYAAGAAVAWGALLLVHPVVDPNIVFLGLGALPFVAVGLSAATARAAATTPAGAAGALPARSPGLLDFADPRGAVLCGGLVAGTQLVFGVAGPLLDLFFVHTRLLRREVVSTKAVTQALSHALKIAFFLPLLGIGAAGAASSAPGSLAVAAAVSVAGALAGTWVGGRLLERVSEEHFRRWTRRLILVIGAVYLVKGIVGLAPSLGATAPEPTRATASAG